MIHSASQSRIEDTHYSHQCEKEAISSKGKHSKQGAKLADKVQNYINELNEGELQNALQKVVNKFQLKNKVKEVVQEERKNNEFGSLLAKLAGNEKFLKALKSSEFGSLIEKFAGNEKFLKALESGEFGSLLAKLAGNEKFLKALQSSEFGSLIEKFAGNEKFLKALQSGEFGYSLEKLEEQRNQSELKGAFAEFSFNSDISDLLESDPEKGSQTIADILKHVELEPEMYTKVEKSGGSSGEPLVYEYTLNDDGIEFFSSNDVGKAFLYEQYEQLGEDDKDAVKNTFGEVDDIKKGASLQTSMSNILNDPEKMTASQWRDLGETILMNTPPEDLDDSLYNDVTTSKHGSENPEDWTYNYDLTDTSMTLLLAIDDLQPEETDVENADGVEFNLKGFILAAFEELPTDVKEGLVDRLLDSTENEVEVDETGEPVGAPMEDALEEFSGLREGMDKALFKHLFDYLKTELSTEELTEIFADFKDYLNESQIDEGYTSFNDEDNSLDDLESLYGDIESIMSRTTLSKLFDNLDNHLDVDGINKLVVETKSILEAETDT